MSPFAGATTLRQQSSFICRSFRPCTFVSTLPTQNCASQFPKVFTRETSAMQLENVEQENDLDDLDDNDLDEMEQQAPVVEEAKLFVGNLSWDTTDHSLGDAFSRYGTVVEARVVTDRFTGKSRGFGFIEYESAGSADEALVGMNGYEVDGRKIRVDRANKRPPRPRRNPY